MEIKHRILYIGGFKLPDKNAAAHRVMANAKALRDLGHDVLFINYDSDGKTKTETTVSYQGFLCYLEPEESLFSHLVDCSTVKRIIKKEDIDIVIAYNYPSIALNRIGRFCKKRNIRCIADVTEWYVYTGSTRFKIIKNADTNYRMKYIHPKLDGIIVISDYLYDYYSKKVKTVKIPPLVDSQERKWNVERKRETDSFTLCYAGEPSRNKERLDLIVDSIEEMSRSTNVTLLVIGITEQEFQQIYHKTITSRVKFLGRLSNHEVIQYTTNSDWSIIIRDNNLAVKAGFPTKVVESITCGTPVIANRFSNIEDYLDKTNSILVSDTAELKAAIEHASTTKLTPDRTIFDYRNYLGSFKSLLNG